MKKYYIISLLLLASCAPNPGTYTFSSEFANWQINRTLEVMEMLPKTENSITDIRFTMFNHDRVLGRACLDCDPCKIQINKRLKYEYYIVVVWHEYGHCMGLEHTESGIMAPILHTIDNYSEQDIIDFKDMVR